MHVPTRTCTHAEEGDGLGNDVLVAGCEFVANEAREHGSAVAMIPPLKFYVNFGPFRTTTFRNKYVSIHSCKQKRAWYPIMSAIVSMPIIIIGNTPSAEYIIILGCLTHIALYNSR